MDGVFFVDGGFAGPNQLGTWEQLSFAAEAYLACAKLACEARERGMASSDFFDQLKELTGCQGESFAPPPPPPPPPPSGPPDLDIIHKRELWSVGRTVNWMLKSLGEEAAIDKIAGWSALPVPKLHKL